MSLCVYASLCYHARISVGVDTIYGNGVMNDKLRNFPTGILI